MKNRLKNVISSCGFTSSKENRITHDFLFICYAKISVLIANAAGLTSGVTLPYRAKRAFRDVPRCGDMAGKL